MTELMDLLVVEMRKQGGNKDTSRREEAEESRENK